MGYQVIVTFTDDTVVSVNNTSPLAEIVGIVLAHSTKTLADIKAVAVHRVDE